MDPTKYSLLSKVIKEFTINSIISQSRQGQFDEELLLVQIENFYCYEKSFLCPTFSFSLLCRNLIYTITISYRGFNDLTVTLWHLKMYVCL